MNIENIAHFVMQSKGGAGKSVVSYLLAQYLQDLAKDLMIVDIDASNKTLGSFKKLDVNKINVLNKNKLVDQSKFDSFIDDFAEADKPMLVDTGAGDFLAINGYMVEQDLPAVFKEMDKKIIIHVPLNFAQSKEDTMKCCIDLLTNHKEATIVIWENEFFGENLEDIHTSQTMKKFDNIGGVVKIRQLNKDTDQKDFTTMLENKLTFDEAFDTANKHLFGFSQKIRLKRIKNDIWGQLDELFDGLAAAELKSEAE